jgi:hypothetical protein
VTPVESRLVRRAYVEKLGWGLTQETWDRIDQVIEEVDTWENEDRRSIAEMVLVGLEVGTYADKVARITGLNRDNFVRPKAKLLRDNGCWVDGKMAFSPEAMDDESGRYSAMEIILTVLVAEGRITRENTT